MFLAGLAVILLGGLGAMSNGGTEGEIVVIVVLGFGLLISSVILR